MAAVLPSQALLSNRAPWWLPGGHLQTIWPSLFSRSVIGEQPRFRRERWTTPDQDFIDVDFLDDSQDGQANAAKRPLLVLFHGLEGSSKSGYAQAFACLARAQGWSYAVPHFRGCSGELNLAPRAYHSGDFEEVEWILQRMAERRRCVLQEPSQCTGWAHAVCRTHTPKQLQASLNESNALRSALPSVLRQRRPAPI